MFFHSSSSSVQSHGCAQVGMTRPDTELWISQLIRSSRLDARIDGAAGTIVMGTQYVDPLDAVVERTTQLSVKTFQISNKIIDAMQKPQKPLQVPAS
jgi:hypothetical protein